MISNSPDSSVNVFHIHFHFQENISAETVILTTFQAFGGATKKVVWGAFYLFIILFAATGALAWIYTKQIKQWVFLPQYIVFTATKYTWFF